jgi:type I restriction-modification system DNA methylase subunit
MNMILHNNPTAEIWQDNTLSSPHWKERDGSLKLYDFVVANVPFSTKSWSNGFNPADDEFGRFTYGIPPTKNGDYAFLLHILASLKSTGKGAVILPHGVLFRGNVDEDIRRNIVARGYIKGIIGLPANLFYGTSIPACIIVTAKTLRHTASNMFRDRGISKGDGVFIVTVKQGQLPVDLDRDLHREHDSRRGIGHPILPTPANSRQVFAPVLAEQKFGFSLALRHE